MIKTYSVKSDFVNSRLDRWYKKNICNVPQSLLEKNLRKGKIKVNNKKEKSSYKLKIDDKIIIYNFFPKIEHKKKYLEKYMPRKDELTHSSKMIIENNEDFVIINKPAGIAVQSGTKSKRNIMDILEKTKEFNGIRPFTVHRIDKETSGVLIVAKNRKFAQLFTSLFRLRKIYKTYLGITIGELANKKDTFIDDLFYYEGQKKIKTRAITSYKVIDSNAKFSLVELHPSTGRKHQLRKQLLIHGCPIYGDSKYRISDTYKNKNENLMLHAYKISFTINSKKYNFAADLPLYFENFLKQKYLKNS